MHEMWDKIKGAFEKHPWLFAIGIFIVGLLFILWWRRGSSTTTAAPDNSGYYQAAAAAVNSGNQLQSVQAQIAGQTAVAGLAAQTQQAAIAANADVQKTSLADALQALQIQTGAQENEAVLSSNLNQTIAGYNLDQSIALANIEAASSANKLQISGANAVALAAQQGTNAVNFENVSSEAVNNLTALQSEAADNLATIEGQNAVNLTHEQGAWGLADLQATGLTEQNIASTQAAASEVNAFTTLAPQLGIRLTQPNAGAGVYGIGSPNVQFLTNESNIGGPASPTTLAEMSPEWLAAHGFNPSIGIVPQGGG